MNTTPDPGSLTLTHRELQTVLGWYADSGSHGTTPWERALLDRIDASMPDLSPAEPEPLAEASMRAAWRDAGFLPGFASTSPAEPEPAAETRVMWCRGCDGLLRYTTDGEGVSTLTDESLEHARSHGYRGPATLATPTLGPAEPESGA